MLRLVAVLAALAGCSSLPEVPSGCCGNGVLEPGEECDSAEPGCGRPTDGCVALGPSSGAACRPVCAPERGVACPSGYACGRDRICRKPVGTYSLSAAIGVAGEEFQLRDVDGDGAPDLVGRSGHLLHVYRNDGAGGFSTGAGGAVPLDPPGAVLGGLRASDGTPVVSVMEGRGVDLFAVGGDARLHSRLAPALLLDEGAGALHLLGGFVGTDAFVGVRALVDRAAKDGTHALAVLSVDDAGVVDVAALDLGACGPASAAPEVAIATPGRAPSTAALIVDQRTACVLLPGAAPLALDVAPLAASLKALHRPMLADFDGDGALDVLAVMDTPAGDADLVVWLATQAGFAPPAACASPSGVIDDAVAADLNGDGRADLALPGVVFTNASTRDQQGFHPALVETAGLDHGLIDHRPNLAVAMQVAPADLNGDGHTDLAVASGAEGDVALCMGDGSGARFTCAQVATAFPSIDQLFVADVNGDLIDDVVAASRADGVLPGGASVLLGRAQSLADAAAIDMPVLSGVLDGAGRCPRADQIADDLVVAVRGGGGLGVSVGWPHGDGQPTFPLPAPTYDEWIADFDGDHAPDLAMLVEHDPCCVEVEVYRGDGHGGLRAGAQRYPLKPDVPSDLISDLRLVPLGGGLPAVAWDSLAPSFWLALPAGDHYQVAAVPRTITYPGRIVAQDLDGDGQDELVLVDQAPGGCPIYVVRLPAAGGAPTVIDAAVIDGCPDAGTALAPQLFLADVDGDGRLDLFYDVPAAGVDHYRLLRGRADGTFDAAGAVTDPPLVSGMVGAPATAPAPFDASPALAWSGTADVDGDGLLDVLFTGPLGGVMAFADVERGPPRRGR